MTNVPEVFASLPDDVAIAHLDVPFLRGEASLPERALDRAARPREGVPERFTLPVRELVEEAFDRFEERPTAADAWMAPRLHAALRLTRAEAADRGLWNHMALRVAADYVHWRHRPAPSEKVPEPAVNRDNFVGPSYKQAFSKLWWAAEIYRDGYDYAPVELACGNQEMFNTSLRNLVVLHRPTAQAVLRLLRDGTVPGTRQANGLMKAVNAAASTISFESLAPDAPAEPEALQDWVTDETAGVPPFDRLPEGPDDGRAPLPSVNKLEKLFRELFEGAHIRGKEEFSPTG